MTAGVRTIIYHHCPNQQATVIACQVAALPSTPPLKNDPYRNIQSLEDCCYGSMSSSPCGR
jgi:hypothetical protein